MSTDPSTIKPGGKVSVTLTDGTKIINAPTRKGIASGSIFLSDLMVPLLNSSGQPVPNIASIDAYTPPRPEWDRPEVFAVKHVGSKIVRVRVGEDHWAWVESGERVGCATGSMIPDDYVAFAVYAAVDQ